METFEYHGWPGCIRLANNLIEIVASTAFGPRIIRAALLDGGENLLREEEELKGVIGPPDKWVNYGGHRLWHAPEVMPRTYEPDNAQVDLAVHDGEALLLVQKIEPNSKIGKELRIQVGPKDSPTVKIDHILTNHNPWSIEIAPWALSVVAPGGRTILPQEPFKAHGDGDDFAPSRPVVLWKFTDMADPRWTWGTNYIQLRSDETRGTPQKVGIFNTLGWGAFANSAGDMLIKFIDVDDLGPDAHPDLGSNFEVFTKGSFEELETLGPLQILEPGEQTMFTERWALMRSPGLPQDDEGLASVLPAIIQEAQTLVNHLR